MIIYKTIKKISPEKMFKLYKLVSWTRGVKNEKKHGLLISKAYNNSNAVFSAWDDKELVGVVRVVTDNLTHALIFGLAVDPKYTNKGIGQELIKKCIKKYSKMQINLGAEGAPSYKFFKKLGFKDDPVKHLLIGKYVI
jgi:N-acetylglutamate synthase-like GNAT family acetyltransferase